MSGVSSDSHAIAARERQRRLPGREAGHAHHGELRVRGERGERGERPDQRHDREELVCVPGQQQHDVEERVHQPVAALAEIVQFADEVEEREQREEGEDDERGRLEDLAPEVAVDDPHSLRPLTCAATA